LYTVENDLYIIHLVLVSVSLSYLLVQQNLWFYCSLFLILSLRFLNYVVQELKLVRQVIILLAYIASYGKSGFELLLGPVGPTGLNLLELIVQVISAQMNLENNKERLHMI
jgi:hypothetical protein